MKAVFITLLALAAAPALGQVKEVAASGTQFSGSLAARAVSEVQAKEAPAVGNAAAVQFCALSPSVLGRTGNPAMPQNLDGSCISTSSCAAAGGETPAGAGGCSSGACCIKFDCAGANSNSACLNPSLSGDTLRSGQRGAFVSGLCPSGLECFQLSAGFPTRN